MSSVGTGNDGRISSRESDEISLGQLFEALWNRRLPVIFLVLLCTAVATTAAFLVPKKYEAMVLISPVTGRNGSGGGIGGALNAAASQLGGLASIVGLSASGSGGAKAEALATLQSEALTEQYIAEKNLLPVLFSSKWDSRQKQWKVADPEKVPTLWKANRYFNKKIRSVTEASKTGIVTLKITWTDPRQAAQWANDLVKLTNEFLRDKAIAESERDIAYLQQQLDKTNVVELRNSIYSLMESEIKTEMIARGSDEYALKVLDPAVVPEMKSSPQRAVWIAGGFTAGLMAALAWTLVRLRRGN